MKKVALILGLFAAFIFFSCSNLTVGDSSESAEIQNSAATGSLVIVGSDSQGNSRALNVSDIIFAKLEVSGTGISVPLTADSSVSSGKANVTVKDIPVGKNRIVTVYAFDADNKKLGTVVLRAVTDIKAGENTVAVNKNSTALGNVFAALLSGGYDISKIDDAQKSEINSKIDSSKSWALIDSASIATDFSNNSLKSSENYILKTGTVSIINNDGSTSLQIGDPVSAVAENLPAGTSVVENVAPGTWPVYVTKADGTIEKTFVTVRSEENSSITLGEVSDRIIVHAKYTHIWAWKTGEESVNYTGGVWPGKAMTEEENGWYVYTFEQTAVDVLLNNNGNSQHKASGQGGDSLTAGEWWYKDGTWYEENPDDSVEPVLESFTASKSWLVSGEVLLSVMASDDKALSKIVITLDDSNLFVKNVSGTSATAEYTWNTQTFKNGEHVVKAVVYDAAGNLSAVKALNFTTNNENLPPVAKISGTIVAGAGKTISYSAANSFDPNGGDISSYKWTVSGAVCDSTTEKKINVTMPEVAGACVRISLVVTDDEGADSESVSIDVTTVKIDENWDFRDETIYFLMTTRFYDGDKTNNAYCWEDEACFNSITLGDPGWRGDFKGLIERLDYIKALGFSAIWITPVVENSSGLDYHGYHATNFTKVDPRYAGLNEDPMQSYQNLIDACHEKGIKIIQDIVLNHTSNFGEEGIFRIFDTADKRPDAKGVTKAVTAFSQNESVSALSSGLYGLDCLKKAVGGNDYWKLDGGAQFRSRINAMKEDFNDTERAYHHEKNMQWEGYNVQTAQMADDCVDINTENHKVAEYIRNAYIKYINMGVDAFRIDTVKHISRLTFNKEFLPYFKQAGEANGKNFFMFGEGCVLRNEVWNDNKPPISIPFYTWKGNDDSYSWSETDPLANEETVYQHFKDNLNPLSQPVSDNAFLNGNDYHEPDRSQSSGLDMIDFYMHHCFGSAGSAFGVAKQEDRYFNDATYNVTYVDSHDYGPNEGGYLYTRYSGGTDAWANNFSFMFTFRGIPCVYYGSEIEFQKSCQIEPYTNGNKVPYARSGRAYFGDHLEGSVTASDYGVYEASGEVASTLSSPLSQHLIRLNKIRRAIPALRKGQYSTEGCSGAISYKRAYKKNGIDSFVLVTVGGGATFSGVRSGTYIEVVTGKSVNCNGTLTSDSIGEGNARIYVLQTGDGVEPTGKIGSDGAYLK
ncbi:MAG: starch-binding protein [Treponema sp.]|uniref:alpha-amylase family glycosyl hydrolase n=1 Tax=Treponema sp. TaxID=166 RepID=UPI0025EFE066|nr:alpha-amylase family glycosyl hydrolase [Treponema sp.]MBR0494825.1 starch-binding protein [Treponema sp.]